MNRVMLFHHSLTRPLASNVNVAIVRIAHETVSPTFQLPVEFVEHEVAEQGRKWSSLRSPFHAWTDQPVFHRPGFQECPDELQQPLVPDAFDNLTHQLILVDSIEEFLQIQIHHDAVTCSDILLRLHHSLMGLSFRPEP